METKEIFKDIPGYEGCYQVSDMGRVKSLSRTVVDSRGGERFYRGRVLKGSISNKGYRQFSLSVNGKYRTFNASQLVAAAFLGHIPDGFKLVVDHVNGDRSDDRVENLRIVTHRANSSYYYRSDKSSLSSKFTGVSFFKRDKKWRAQILFEDKHIHLGLYDNEIDASNAYQKALAKVKDNTFNPLDYKPVYTSKFKGIYFHKKTKKWMSRVHVNGKQKYIGIYPTELEAYEAVQKFKKKL